MKLIYLLTILFLLSFVSASALTLEAGQILFDGTYDYVLSETITITSLEVVDGEIYINDIAYCNSAYRSKFTTARATCPVQPTTSSGSTSSGGSSFVRLTEETLFVEEKVEEEPEPEDTSSSGSRTGNVGDVRLVDNDDTTGDDKIIYDEVTMSNLGNKNDELFTQRFIGFFTDVQNRAKITLITLVIGLFGITLISMQKIKYHQHGHKYIHTRHLDVQSETTGEKTKK